MPTSTSTETERHRVVVIDGELPDGFQFAPDAEPDFHTAPEDLTVQKELMDREPIFHRPLSGTSRQQFEKMTAAEFWETGASGRRYSRQFCLDTLEKKYQKTFKDTCELRDIYCRKLAPEVYLFTYTLFWRKRTTRRVTIWRRHGNDWQAVYHQGTVVEGAT